MVEGHSLWHKADLRSFVALIVIGAFLGSWIYFIAVTPVDETKKLDGPAVFDKFIIVLLGTIVGIFAWLGFKQGGNGQSPILEIPVGMKLIIQNGKLALVQDKI